MLTESIIVAIISSITTITGVILVNKRENAKYNQEKARWSQHIDDEINSIKKKLDTHNHYAEKFGEIEKSIVRIDTTLISLKEKR